MLGAILSYSSIIFNIVAGLLYTPWMIRTIGDDQYALYTLAVSIVNLFLIDFGIGAAVSKFLSNYYAKGQQQEANRFLGLVYRVFFLISSLIAVCLGVYFLFFDSIYAALTAEELQTLKRLFLLVATFSVLTFPCTTFNGVLMASEQFIAVKACNLGQRVCSVGMIVIALLTNGSVYSLVLAHTLSNAAFYLLKYLFIRKNTSNRADFSCRDGKLAKQLLGFSAWVLLMNLAQRCIFNIMPTIIAAVVSTAAVTLFSLAAALEGYVYSLGEAVNGMFLPRISRILTTERSEEDISNLMCRVGRFHVYTIGLLFIGFLCVGEQFVLLWMGTGYERVYVCAALLIFPSLIDVPQQIAKTALMAKDIVRPQAFIYLVMAAVNVCLSLLLLPTFGVIGAAIAVCISYLFRTACFNYLYYKHLHINLLQYFKATYLRWVPTAVGSLLIGYLIMRFDVLSGWGGLVAKCVIIGVVYLVLLFLFTFMREDRTRMLHALGKKET